MVNNEMYMRALIYKQRINDVLSRISFLKYSKKEIIDSECNVTFC